MHSLKVCVSTQTPLLKFDATSAGATTIPDLPSDVANSPYHFSAGGVSRMVVQTVKDWLSTGFAKQIDWFSLQPHGPRSVDLQNPPVRITHLSLPRADLQAYARTKEKLWAEIHGLAAVGFQPEDFRFYSQYNSFTSDAILARVPDVDLAYIHDFQQLQVGSLIGLAAPCVMRWHVPFVPQIIPEYTRNFILRKLEDYDGVIVSTLRDLEGLRSAGFRGHVRQIYPHSTPHVWTDPTATELARTEADLHIGPDDPVVLVVARMDPMKRQDVAIRAIARLKRKFPTIRLVLVGNGSFSGSRTSGLGLGKADRWAETLQKLTQETGTSKNVVFAHWLPDHQLGPLYGRADVVLLPSDLEGFGLTVLEAWHYRRAVVACKGAGVAETITDGENALLFDPGDDETLARHIEGLLSKPDRALVMGEAAFAGLWRFDVKERSKQLREVMEYAIDSYRGTKVAVT